MKLTTFIMAVLANLFLMTSFGSAASGDDHHEASEQNHQEAKGPNNGRMLTGDGDGEFALELVLFERSKPAKYRIYPSLNHEKIAVKDVHINIKLTRLGNIIDQVSFSPEGEYLQGDIAITEPHSFDVDVNATYKGKTYHWHFESHEGRTKITQSMAREMGITTQKVEARMLTETLTAYGKLALAPNAQRHISARFPGVITTLNVTLGQQISKGQKLMTIESNESLQQYDVIAPIAGIITMQNTAQGEQSEEKTLLTIADPTQLIAELDVYPLDQPKVVKGASVIVSTTSNNIEVKGEIVDSLVNMNEQQAKTYRVNIDNSQGHFSVGQFINAKIDISSYQVPLAVNVNALQSFRDFTVVYEKIGEQYEVRMLNLGRRAGQWVEVLSGISEGSEYVVGNSYLIKADIDKAGASHDH